MYYSARSRSVRRFKINQIILVVMHILVCRESGLDCDFVIKGETKEEFLKNGADHAIQTHGMHAEDIYSNVPPVNLLCHSFNEETQFQSTDHRDN